MAHSPGFTTPPPDLLGQRIPTSAASVAEYVELGMGEVCDPANSGAPAWEMAD